MYLVALADDFGMTVDESERAAEHYARVAGHADPGAWRLVGRAVVDSTWRSEALDFLSTRAGMSAFARHRFDLALGDDEAAIAYLQDRRDLGAIDLGKIGTLPEWDHLRGDPRFIEIVRELGVPNGYDPVAKQPRWP